jgi:hypothetical protein
MRRLVRLATAIALAFGWQFGPSTPQPAAAADCVTFYCAKIILLPTGTGTGYMSTFPGGIDCEWTGAAPAIGACTYEFSWSRSDPDGIDVDVYLDPGVHAYACLSGCGGLEQRHIYHGHLNPGADIYGAPSFNLANRTHVAIDSSGNGGGRTTGTPGGLNCSWNGIAESGTCDADVWYVGSSINIQFSSTPDNATTFACHLDTSCAQPGQVFNYAVGTAQATLNSSSQFWVVTPLTVVVDGPGTLVSSPSGISCPPNCSKWFNPGTLIHLVAAPGSGATLTAWNGDCANTPVTNADCFIVASVRGNGAGVQFVGPATPPPAVTPRPTVKPTVTPSAVPTAPPTHPVSSTARATSAVPSSAAPAAPSASIGPDEGPVAASGSPGTASPSFPGASVVSVAATAQPSPGPGQVGLVHPNEWASLDSTLLLLVIVLALVLGLVLGGIVVYALSRRRRAGATRPRA